MGKIFYNLYQQVCHSTNLWRAFEQAARGKRMHLSVAAFEFDLEEQMWLLHKELTAQTYTPGAYHNFIIGRPKRRLISAAPFRDRVVHHALMNIIAPLFERQFIFDSYANRKDKGTHRALDRCTDFMRRYRYVMHCDVRQFFPSVDHQILRAVLARTIGDPDVMRLIDQILVSGAHVQAREYTMVYFPGDDLFAAQRLRGLPIGNLTSQFWANVYLNGLDQHIKRTLKCAAYLRYVDDLVLFADDSRTLLAWRQAIIEFLQGLRLTLHETRAQPRPVATGLPFLGFHVFLDHRRLKRRNGIAFQRRLKTLAERWFAGEIETRELEASLNGWINHARHGDTWGLRRAVLTAAGLSWDAWE
ncbi:MAG: RNA-dependent DNA polymerase [Chloroflexi bacterium]|nr:RNA-dependent DNA polymerase [Chloroflexota bacterium]